MFRLLDTLALLAAPFAAAFDQEFGGRPRPVATTPPAPEPNPPAATPEPAFPGEVAPPLPEVPVIVAESPAPAEPLFVRVGSGRGARYRVDDGSTPGERYRRLVGRGGKARFTPVEARR